MQNITFVEVSGESASSVEISDNCLTKSFLQIHRDYKDDQIFNSNETRLFFLWFKGEKCSGEKLAKERITVMVATNMTGTNKRKLLVMDKSTKPCCFKNIIILPIHYESNKKESMISAIFISTFFCLHKWTLK